MPPRAPRSYCRLPTRQYSTSMRRHVSPIRKVAGPPYRSSDDGQIPAKNAPIRHCTRPHAPVHVPAREIQAHRRGSFFARATRAGFSATMSALCQRSRLPHQHYWLLIVDFDFIELTVDFDRDSKSWPGVSDLIFRLDFKFVVYFCVWHLYMVENKSFLQILAFVLCGLSRFMHCSIRFHSLFLWRSSIRFILLVVGTLRSDDLFWAEETHFNWPTYALSNAAITGHCNLT